MTKKSENNALEEGRRLQAEAVAAQEERDQVQPTPSQDENDRAKLGEVAEVAWASNEAKSETAEKPSAGYKTRSASAE